MSTKRTSAESSSDEQTSECSDSFQQDDNAKRARLAFLSDTTLQDLPIELLEIILIKVVTTEVKDSKLVKNVWKEKADRVMNRLITVSPLWSSIITTDIFRNKVNRILDDTAQKPIRLEILKQFSSPEVFVLDMTTLKDEMFVLWPNYHPVHGYFINVYDLNNFDQVKDVIALPGRNPLDLTACSVSTCVYLLDKKKWFEVTVLRITKDDNNQFNVSALISIPWLPHPTLSVTTTGGFILSRHQGRGKATVSTFNADGTLQHEMKLPLEISEPTYIIQKSNGNLVLVSDRYRPKVTEIDPNDGTVLRQYVSPDSYGYLEVIRTDFYGRVLMIENQSNRLMLLDSEFNPLYLTSSSQLHQFRTVSPRIWHYNSERNEIVSILLARNETVSFVGNGYKIVRFVNPSMCLPGRGKLTILGFKDE